MADARRLLSRGGSFGAVAGAGVLAAGLLAACAARKPQESTPAPRAATPDAGEIARAQAYDWHDLLTVPLGTRLKDMPMRMHEVWVFRADPRRAADADALECYGTDAPPPLLLGRPADAFALCFAHDRLFRIEAQARYSAPAARQLLERACAEWSARASVAVRTADGCEGTEGPIHFSARLATDAEGPDAPIFISLSPAGLDEPPP